MKKITVLLTLILVLILLAACSDQEEATPEAQATEVQEAPTEAPPTEPPPTEPPATEPPPTEAPPTAESVVAGMDHVPDPQLTDKTWEWERRDNSSGETMIIVPNPEAYTLLFNEDGTLQVTLDCNNASGLYATPNSGSIFMELGAMTAAACGPESLDDQMANMFGPAQDYRFEEEGQVLVFSWAAGGPVDYYRDADAEKSDEEPGEAEVNSIPADAIQMDLQGLADFYTWSVQPGRPASPGPGGEGFPPHILMTFDGATPEEVMANNGPRMYIFPTQAYINLSSAEGSTIVADQVIRLEQLIAEANTRQGDPDSPMPLLPPPNSFMDRWVQFLDLDFGVGSGVRYISDSPNRQQLGPWTNETTDYYYEGLTTNGIFYVSLMWPESTESLPDTLDDVPEDVLALATDPDTYPDYLQATKDTLNGLSATDWDPSLARLDAMVKSLTFPTSLQPSLTGTTWQWASITTPVEQTDVEDPSRYTILFDENNTAEVKADCNNVGATYTTDGNNISITLGPSTLAACPPDSLDQEYLSNLENAAIYFFDEGDLFMDLVADSGTMRFTAGEESEQPPPEDSQATGEATGTITAPDGVYLRSGPGTEYPPIGAVPFGATGEITGQSEDGQWWEINVPATTEAPGGQGWVAAEFVEATNTENVPVVEAPEVPEATATPIPAGTPEATATPDPDSITGGAEGTLFQLISFGPEGDVQPILEGTQITATFAEAQVTGSAGCNDYTGTLTAVDDYFTVGPIITTQRACAEPEGIMEQEQAYLTALEGTSGFQWETGLVGGSTIITAGQLSYTLSDGINGVINFIAP